MAYWGPHKSYVNFFFTEIIFLYIYLFQPGNWNGWNVCHMVVIDTDYQINTPSYFKAFCPNRLHIVYISCRKKVLNVYIVFCIYGYLSESLNTR